MSEMEHYSGILREIPKLENETLEEQCKRLLDVDEIDIHYESYKEMFEDKNYGEYVIYNDLVYEITSRKADPYDDIFVANKNSDGSISFEVQYYNGGCGYSDAIEIALSNIREN